MLPFLFVVPAPAYFIPSRRLPAIAVLACLAFFGCPCGYGQWTSAGSEIQNQSAYNILSIAGDAGWGTAFLLQATGSGGNTWGFQSTDGGASQGQGKLVFRNWFAGLDALTITGGGSVGIGTVNPAHMLHVAGTIGAEEVIVTSNGADYVFQPGYRLQPLSEVAAFIKQNHHLPVIPSETEVQQNGLSVGEMQAKLLAKVEELTLHMIRTDERNTRLAQENRDLKERLARLEALAVSR
jgi:hypothetical protein